MKFILFNALLILQGFQTALGLLVGLFTYNNFMKFMTSKSVESFSRLVCVEGIQDILDL